MTEIYALWLPILLSAVFVFIISSIIHMALPAWHKTDYPKLPQEKQFMELLRPLNLSPGDYMTPGCDNMAEMKTPEFQERIKLGPVIFMTILPNGMFSMGKPLVLWFIYCIVVSAFSGLIAGIALPHGAEHGKILHIVGFPALMGYTFALWQFSIWYQRRWLTTIKSTIDGLIYAIATAATFVWLWPQ
jgi:hypothetical protein